MQVIYDDVCDLGSLRTILPQLQKGDRVFLRGDLGTGKTTIATYLIRDFLGEDVLVTSPTYTYYQMYPQDVVHFDLYRVESSDDFVRIGAQDIFDQDETTCIVEWADRIPDEYMPTYDIVLSHTDDPANRRVRITAY